ncbi:MAG: alpha-2-macroglobulin family protein [Bacteroidota bacterium]
MTISDELGSTNVSVEEYKRPKFEVDFLPVTGNFKLGEKIKVEGTAKAYAGSSIDGASVQFRVVRSCRVPHWMSYRWGYLPQLGSTEILNGQVKTDETGKFSIEFPANEDKTIDKKYLPTYTYTIYADVTDISGETRSGEQYVRVGYTAMELSVGVGSIIEKSSGNKFKVSTTNLMGEKVTAGGTIRVFPLIENDRVLRSSLWKRPDLSSFSEEEFRKLFPHDEFKNELKTEQLSTAAPVLILNFDTRVNDTVEFKSMKNWKSGRYMLEATSLDAFGETVTDIIYFTLLDRTESTNPTNQIWTLTPLKTNCEPGENAEFLLSAGAENLTTLFEIEHKNKVVHREFITLNKGQKLISIPVEEQHRGNFSVHFAAVKFGRSFRSSSAVTVPFSNKELDVTFETFRDKLQPGQKEEWRIRIKGPKGEKVAAEMVAALYDASLDAFAPNSFYLNVWNSYYTNRYWSTQSFDASKSRIYYSNWNQNYSYTPRNYSLLNYWGFETMYYGMVSEGHIMRFDDSDGMIRGADRFNGDILLENVEVRTVARGKGAFESKKKDKRELQESNYEIEDSTVLGFTGTGEKQDDKKQYGELGNIKARSDMSETAFFMPQLKTNEKGEIIISFTIPEALTRWNFIGLAHTKDLKSGVLQKQTVTQKELMVIPNAPRFLREGDQMEFTAKVSNLSEGDLNGTARLILTDALTGASLDELFGLSNTSINFTALKGQSAGLSWKIKVPEGIGAVTYKVVAQAKNHTDGEEGTLPILSNRMLVTESLPLPSRGIGKKEFIFEKLKNSGSSTSIKHHRLTLEYTSNPAWYAIQALPYMMEYPHECAEQIFSRFYANSLAFAVVNSNPKIKEVFNSWKESSPEAFLSNLEKNQELKSVILQETPWLLDAKNESERKKRIALLFELHKMERQLDRALSKLEKMQVSNGGWPWFPGMEDNRYITQHIVTGLGHLDKLGVREIRENKRIWKMVVQAVNYLDARMVDNYRNIQAYYPAYRNEQHISELHVQYLYARSYFSDIPIQEENIQEAYQYFHDQAITYWKNFNIYNEGMIALFAKRSGVAEVPEMIMASLKERAIEHEELGMYWKDNVTGYFWYQAPIETQALMIEAFDEITGDLRTVEDLKVWLLKQKQTTDWKTTKATAEACYALLLRGTNLLLNTEAVEIKMAGKVIDPKELGAKVEAGTGYFRTSWNEAEIKPEMAQISVTRKTEGVSWGAVYWQYFEDLDKITTHETPLKLAKKLFLVVNTESGPVITPITDQTALKPGDKIRVRIELRSDRDMEYIHMRDMRASGFEPINVFSQYKWQDGLGYYESTGDAATNFFMDYVRKGTYVFEYDVRVTHLGDFSNGITTIQCMYAPEFTSHSEGIRVKVEQK